MRRRLFGPEHEVFRDLVRTFIENEVVPHHARWEEEGQVDRDVWLAAGKTGLLGMDQDERYGGGGEADYRFHVVLAEEMAKVGAHGPGFSLHNEIIGPYLRELTTEEQRARWLPGFCGGDLITAIAITEPEAGSDIQGIRTRAVRDGDDFVLNGQKTFISNGMLANLILVVARTEGGPRKASILAVEADTPGLIRRRLDNKLGMRAQDTAELFFTDVRVPARNVVGGEGRGFGHLMRKLARERLSIGVTALATAEQAVEETVDYCRQREVFGRRLSDFQNTRFVIAELSTALEVARAFTDRCIEAHDEDELEASDAAMVKWWTTELCRNALDRCLQLHGGYGYMRDYAVARMWLDTRPQTIYGGTTDVMKELIGQSIL